MSLGCFQKLQKSVGDACPQGALKHRKKRSGTHVLRVLSKIAKIASVNIPIQKHRSCACRNPYVFIGNIDMVKSLCFYMAVGNEYDNQNIYKSGPGPRTHNMRIVNTDTKYDWYYILLIPILNTINTVISLVLFVSWCFLLLCNISQIATGVPYSESPRKKAQSAPICFINIGCNLTCFGPVQRFDLLGWGSHVLRVLSTI
jgi:hypothetical protein